MRLPRGTLLVLIACAALQENTRLKKDVSRLSRYALMYTGTVTLYICKCHPGSPGRFACVANPRCRCVCLPVF